jgi:CheY-like chemotaxis protein
VQIEVADNGAGIPQAMIARVFEPFFTTKDKGKGTGLGLSMVYGFIKQSQGHIDLRSVPGEGTAVTLLLPAIGDDRDIDDAQQEWEGDLRGNDQCVLLVEDDPAVRRFTNNQLRSLGYRTLLAANGHDGLEMLKAHPDVAVLLTDVVMPGGMSGRELAELARVYRPDLPVLFASGYTEDELSRDGRLEDGLVLLNKPYRRVELARRLKQVMARCGVAQDE